MYDPAQLSALSAVIRLGAFDAAAHALGVTPSAISQRIKALEDRIGQSLYLLQIDYSYSSVVLWHLNLFQKQQVE